MSSKYMVIHNLTAKTVAGKLDIYFKDDNGARSVGGSAPASAFNNKAISSKYSKTTAEYIKDLQFGEKEEQIEAASALIDKLNAEGGIENEKSWELIKDLLGVLIEHWAITQLRSAVEKLQENNDQQNTWGETQAYVVGKVFYQVLDRIEGELQEKESEIIFELGKRLLSKLPELITILLDHPVEWLVKKVVSLFKKDKDTVKLMETLKENPEQAWEAVKKMKTEEVLVFFEEADNTLKEEGISAPLPEGVAEDLLSDLAGRLEEGFGKAYASAPEKYKKKVKTTELAYNLNSHFSEAA